LKKYYILMF